MHSQLFYICSRENTHLERGLVAKAFPDVKHIHGNPVPEGRVACYIGKPSGASEGYEFEVKALAVAALDQCDKTSEREVREITKDFPERADRAMLAAQVASERVQAQQERLSKALERKQNGWWLAG